MMDVKTASDFLSILREELIPAMGCTEPISLAYASARAREVLGRFPDRILARCSGNMIKNVRCVTIPNSGGMTGIECACTLGAFGGDASRVMEVLEAVTPEARERTKRFLEAGNCQVVYLESDIPLHFVIEATAGEDTVVAEVRHGHVNIVSMEKNGSVIFRNDSRSDEAVLADRSALNVEAIKEFADTVGISQVKPLLDRQIRCNMDIAYEGMSGGYGLGIGQVIRDAYPESIVTRMRAYAAAASEARMDGCDMPVIINSGSGNQGIASSVPVIVYAREKAIPQERLYRALVFSGLLTIYQKEFIGKLSAFCGAVSASCAAGAAITYMIGGTVRQIKDTIDNTLADIPGVICDGAKTSCAAKIASAIDAAMLAHALAMRGKTYEAFTGILKEDAGETISCVGYIGKVGMKQTDKEIVRLMLNES
ncbi:MAG: serine dehydratase subunit alpha family protein [Ruminococcaceae bacterium]|nr:serine dehydratase subunit alpha family protein [Oscillospiraceae bacterium]